MQYEFESFWGYKVLITTTGTTLSRPGGVSVEVVGNRKLELEATRTDLAIEILKLAEERSNWQRRAIEMEDENRMLGQQKEMLLKEIANYRNSEKR